MRTLVGTAANRGDGAGFDMTRLRVTYYASRAARGGTPFPVFRFFDGSSLHATAFDFSQATAIAAGSLCWGELHCVSQLTREDWLTMNFLNNGALSSCDSAQRCSNQLTARHV